MYAYVYAFDVVRLLLYNIQSFDHNTICNNNAHVTVQNNNECDNSNDIVHATQTYIYGVYTANNCYDNFLASHTVCNNNRAYDVALVDLISNSSVVLGQVPRNITYNNNIYEDVLNNNIYDDEVFVNTSFAITNVNTYTDADAGDVDYELFYPILEYNNHDRNNDCELVFDTKDNTACNNNERACYDVGTLRCAHYDIGTVQCGNNNTLPFYLPWKQVLF